MLKLSSGLDSLPRWPHVGKGHQMMSISGPAVHALPSCSQLSFGQAHRKQLQQEGHVIKGHSVNFAARELTIADSPIQEPATRLHSSGDSADQSDLVEACENALPRHVASKPAHLDYVTCTAQNPRRRSALELPQPPLSTTRHLLATRDHVPGVHSSQVRINFG